MADTNIIPLLDAYEAARADTDRLWLTAGRSDAAAAAHEAAVSAEEGAVDACVAELRRLAPELTYKTARGMVAIPAYRAKVRAIYG